MTKRTVLVALVGCALFGGACRNANDAHYAAVESNREAQAAQPAASTAAGSGAPDADTT